MGSEWEVVPMDELARQRQPLHRAYLDAQEAAYPFRRQMTSRSDPAERFFGAPNALELESIEGLREAYANEVRAEARWNAYKAELARRLDPLSLTEILNRWHATHVQGQWFPLTRLYWHVMNARMQFLFYDRVFEYLFMELDVAALSKYKLSRMLEAVDEWIAWKARHPELVLAVEPNDRQIEAKVWEYRRTQEFVRQYQAERDLALVMATHRRLGGNSWLHRLDSEMLHDIAMLTMEHPKGVIVDQSWLCYPPSQG
jgi:hypothetical protein